MTMFNISRGMCLFHLAGLMAPSVVPAVQVSRAPRPRAADEAILPRKSSSQLDKRSGRDAVQPSRNGDPALVQTHSAAVLKGASPEQSPEVVMLTFPIIMSVCIAIAIIYIFLEIGQVALQKAGLYEKVPAFIRTLLWNDPQDAEKTTLKKDAVPTDTSLIQMEPSSEAEQRKSRVVPKEASPELTPEVLVLAFPAIISVCLAFAIIKIFIEIGKVILQTAGLYDKVPAPIRSMVFEFGEDQQDAGQKSIKTE